MSANLSKKKFTEFKKGIRYSKYFNSFDPFLSLPEKKFFIYTGGRTGSTVLTDLLNSHPDMYCDHEIFDTSGSLSPVKHPLLYISSCSKRAVMNRKPVYGFKVKIEQLIKEHNYKEIGELLKLFYDKGWKVIYLKRTNIFKHAVSGIISNHTKIFHVKNDNGFEHEKLNIDCNFLIGVMGYYDELGKSEEESLKAIPHLRIIYEEDLLDSLNHQYASDKVFDYLGIKSHPVNTNLKKIIPEDLEKIVLNFQEVHSFIKNSKYKNFLD